jgi:hypothetical protein
MNRTFSRLISLFGSLAILILLALIISFSYNTLPAQRNGSSAYPGPQDLMTTEVVSPEVICDQFFAFRNGLPESQRKLFEEDVQNCINARKSPSPEWKGIPSPETPSTTNYTNRFFSRPAGDGTITESSNSPFHSWFRIINKWTAAMGENRVTVYAGGQAKDATGGINHEDDLSWLGVLNIESVNGNGDYIREESGSYQTPTNGGPVRIVDANGVVLTLVSTRGNTYYFDVARREYLSLEDDSPAIRSLGFGTLIESPIRQMDTDDYQIVNQWFFVDERGRSISILAGGVRDGFEKKGVIVVATLLPGKDIGYVNTNTYVTSYGNSYLRIVDANEQSVIFVSESGSMYEFNTYTMEFGPLPDSKAILMVEPNSILSPLWDTAVVTVMPTFPVTKTPIGYMPAKTKTLTGPTPTRTATRTKTPTPSKTSTQTTTNTGLPTYNPYP